jgi:hypothetical protein
MIGFQKQVEILLLAQLDRHRHQHQLLSNFRGFFFFFFPLFGFRYIFAHVLFVVCDTRQIKYLATL